MHVMFPTIHTVRVFYFRTGFIIEAFIALSVKERAEKIAKHSALAAGTVGISSQPLVAWW